VDSPFKLYKSGIYDETSPGACAINKLGSQVVTVVGYTQDYWIIKNSWGDNWGESGFIRVRMSKDSTGVCNMYYDGGYYITF
jgi:hypothetical protein